MYHNKLKLWMCSITRDQTKSSSSVVLDWWTRSILKEQRTWTLFLTVCLLGAIFRKEDLNIFTFSSIGQECRDLKIRHVSVIIRSLVITSSLSYIQRPKNQQLHNSRVEPLFFLENVTVTIVFIRYQSSRHVVEHEIYRETWRQCCCLPELFWCLTK